MPDLSTTEALLRLLLAAGLGGAIGLERELRDHEAGFRTHLLVSLGSCAFTLVSAYGWSDWTFSTAQGVVFDPTRIAAQIVTGIGFLGAGAIIVRGINVRGLTTAATLWVVAAIGMAAGTGYYAVGIGAAVLVLVSLGPLKFVSARFISRVRPEEAELAIALKPDGRRGSGPGPDRGAGGHREHRRVRGRPHDGRCAASVTTVGVGARRRVAHEARGCRARAVAALEPRRAQLASGNAHKLDELRAVLPGWEIELLGADAFPAEDGETYYENARGKARFGREVGEPGAWILGEDSGIEAVALGGRPGVASARWAEDGVAQLLAELDGAADRRARYVCELVALSPDGRELPGYRHPRGDDRERAPRERGFRLRPDLHPGRRGADGGRARKRLEELQLPPRPRRRCPPHVHFHDVLIGHDGSWPRHGCGGRDGS